MPKKAEAKKPEKKSEANIAVPRGHAPEPQKKFDPKAIEAKWKEFWQKEKIFSFNRKPNQPVFTIDTPPPYPTGELHPGHLFNWSYIDFVARYKRMQGFAVHFPQGWDVHGLPTESKVEKWKGKKSGEVTRDIWVKWCEEWTEKYIKGMKEGFTDMGISMDWALEYQTSMPEYMRMVQLSFLKTLEKGFAYRGRHPVNWCPSCRTAISDAEVEYQEREGKMFHIKFNIGGGGSVVIATTRPELLPACVAMSAHPDDERYKNVVGRRAIVPLFSQEVEILASDKVDPSFGTGLMMTCTFGDKEDVDLVIKHELPIIDVVDEKGQMTAVARKYQGLTTAEAKKVIVADLEKEGRLLKEEKLQQSVGGCWRCKHPIEILNKEQWFMRAMQFREKVIEETKKVRWIPEWMSKRQVQWAEGLKWDWVISRQKVYGTPIPVWYCDKCNDIIPAEEKELPVDPSLKEKKCPKCKSRLRGETDTMDTWMDSSVSNYWHAGWPNEGWEAKIPASLQPNGAEIIRTWDYYLMLRSLMLTEKPSYKEVLINGWVTDETGQKMSKSLGNYTPVSEIMKRSSADAIRYWVSRSTAGTDYPFNWKDLEHASRFYNKLYNMFSFFNMAMDKAGKSATKHPEELVEYDSDTIELADRAVLSKLNRLIESATKDLESYRWPMLDIETFVWFDLADYYLEMIKFRIYQSHKAGQALWTLYTCLLKVTQLMAPFAPFIAEELYQHYFRRFVGEPSVHLTKWPQADKDLMSEAAEELYEKAKDVIAAVRQYKTTNKLPLNAPLKEVVIEESELESLADALRGTLKIETLVFGPAEGFRTEKFNIGIVVNK